MTKYLKINPADNVAVAIKDLAAGEKAGGVTLREAILAGHKFALSDLKKDENVIKYGYAIGHTIQDVPAGGWVNEKNIKTNLSGMLEYSYEPVPAPKPDAKDAARTFRGFRRADGSTGIRNEVWIIPTVGCVNGAAGRLAEMLRAETGIPSAGQSPPEGVTGIAAFPHNYGCSQLGGDHENTRKILRDMVLHPNAGGVLVIGLGCENNQISAFKEMLGPVDAQRIKFMETQKVQGDEIEEGMRLLREIYAVASADRREEVPIAELRVGLKCGGSDGFSGITANPLLGVLSDRLTACGGTSVLTEVPEMFGAETILMSRAKDRLTFDKTVSLINDFKGYFLCNEHPIYENPSPGNKAGGISTLEEKSLGCTQKSGGAEVQGVLMYGERLREKGLNLLSAPGNDLVAATALAAAGCQVVLFTTGRGTPFGSFVPTMKISTNSALAAGKPHWIDFNAGVILEGQSMDRTADAFTEYLLKVASGEAVNNEKSGFREIAIFKTGVTL
jgi:altronate hydrolase